VAEQHKATIDLDRQRMASIVDWELCLDDELKYSAQLTPRPSPTSGELGSGQNHPERVGQRWTSLCAKFGPSPMSAQFRFLGHLSFLRMVIGSLTLLAGALGVLFARSRGCSFVDIPWSPLATGERAIYFFQLSSNTRTPSIRSYATPFPSRLGFVPLNPRCCCHCRGRLPSCGCRLKGHRPSAILHHRRRLLHGQLPHWTGHKIQRQDDAAQGDHSSLLVCRLGTMRDYQWKR
jgi:hypothetical protein